MPTTARPAAASDPLDTLSSKTAPDLDGATRLALTDDRARRRLIDGLTSIQDPYRYNCFQVLLRVCADHAALLYSNWDEFLALLDSPNAYHRSIGLRLIACLAAADGESRFERVFDRYFDLLDDESIMVARYLAQSAAGIAAAKPHLREPIVRRLLAVDRLHHEPSRRDLLKTDVIETLGACYEHCEDQAGIRAFVAEQLHCSSPKTRKAAKAFLAATGG